MIRIAGSGAHADVIVVGGGPAGSATAALLADRGWSVTVLERARLPRPKPCGECVNPGAVAALARTGLLADVLALAPSRIDGWELWSGGAHAHGDFPPGGGPGLGLPRDQLDAALLNAARRRGAAVEEGVLVRALGEFDAGGRTLLAREPDGSPGERRARLIVGADGLRSVVARATHSIRRAPRVRKLSLTARVRARRDGSGRGLIWLSDDVTVGLAPVDAAEQLWNVTVVVSARRFGRAAAGEPLRLLQEMAARTRFDWTETPEVVAGPWASGPFDWPARAVAADGVVLVGDAAGYYDPLTGQGIYRALRSAELATDAIDAALHSGRVSGADFGGYAKAHSAAFTSGVRIQHVVEQVVSRRPLRDAFVKRLGSHPAAFDALLAVTGDGRAARSLLAPRVIADFLLPAERSRPG